jgi:hypothetical protein
MSETADPDPDETAKLFDKIYSSASGDAPLPDCEWVTPSSRIRQRIVAGLRALAAWHEAKMAARP